MILSTMASGRTKLCVGGCLPFPRLAGPMVIPDELLRLQYVHIATIWLQYPKRGKGSFAGELLSCLNLELIWVFTHERYICKLLLTACTQKGQFFRHQGFVTAPHVPFRRIRYPLMCEDLMYPRCKPVDVCMSRLKQKTYLNVP